MTRRFLLVCLLAICGTALSARQRPNLSGTWIIQPPNKAAGMEVVVKQDDKTLSFSVAGRSMTHQIDGKEHQETQSMRGGEIVILSKAAWEENALVIVTLTSYPNRMKTFEKEVWTMDARNQLVIERTVTAEGEAAIVTKVFHRRKG
jgi:hypothetical protein